MRAFSQNIFTKFCLFLAILLLSTTLNATEKSKTSKNNNPEKLPNINKLYKVEWVNMDVGYFYAKTISTSNKNNGDVVDFEFKAKSVGIADRFAKFMWNSNTIAKLKNNKFTPVSVDRTGRLKKKTRNIKLKYDAAGNIIFDEANPPESRDKRPAVPQIDKDKSFDVLTMILEVRSKVIDIIQQNNFENDSTSFALPLYDGRKRSNISIDVFKPTAQQIERNIFKIRVRQKLVSGLTKTEISGEKKNAVYIDVVVDAKIFMPISASGKSGLGSANAKFVRDCQGSFEDCVSGR
jgi:hypothetical protein